MTSVRFEWPNQARIALVFDMAWEGWGEDLGTPQTTQHSTRRPFQNATRRTLSYGRDMGLIYERAFAERGGVQRAMRVFGKHGVKMTVLACGASVERFPDLARALDAAGHDVSSENWDHEYHVVQSDEEELDSIARTVAVFQEVLGKHPRGYTCPGSLSTPRTYQIAVEQGYQWIGDLTNSDVPFVGHVAGRPLVFTPHCILHDYTSWTPQQLAEMWRDDFDALYEEGADGDPKMLAYGFHPYLLRGHRSKALDEMIEYGKRHADVWFATRSEIATWMLDRYPDLSLDDLYPEGRSSSAVYGILGGRAGAAV